MYKAGGWQPKAAGGWFALLTFYIIRDTKMAGEPPELLIKYIYIKNLIVATLLK